MNLNVYRYVPLLRSQGQSVPESVSRCHISRSSMSTDRCLCSGYNFSQSQSRCHAVTFQGAQCPQTRVSAQVTRSVSHRVCVTLQCPPKTLQEALQTRQHILSITISNCCLGHLWGTKGRPTRLSASVGRPVFHRYDVCTGTQFYFRKSTKQGAGI